MIPGGFSGFFTVPGQIFMNTGGSLWLFIVPGGFLWFSWFQLGFSWFRVDFS